MRQVSRVPIQENAINSALAEALSGLDAPEFHATPEQTRQATGAKRCDVQVRRNHKDRYYTALECKIGQDTSKKHAAIRDALRWLKEPNCWNALAVCYPNDLKEDTKDTLHKRLESQGELLMVKVGKEGRRGTWKKGGLSDLAVLIDDVGANETYAVTDIIRQAIMESSEMLNEETGKNWLAFWNCRGSPPMEVPLTRALRGSPA